MNTVIRTVGAFVSYAAITPRGFLEVVAVASIAYMLFPAHQCIVAVTAVETLAIQVGLRLLLTAIQLWGNRSRRQDAMASVVC